MAPPSSDGAAMTPMHAGRGCSSQSSSSGHSPSTMALPHASLHFDQERVQLARHCVAPRAHTQGLTTQHQFNGKTQFAQALHPHRPTKSIARISVGVARRITKFMISRIWQTHAAKPNPWNEMTTTGNGEKVGRMCGPIDDHSNPSAVRRSTTWRPYAAATPRAPCSWARRRGHDVGWHATAPPRRPSH